MTRSNTVELSNATFQLTSSRRGWLTVGNALLPFMEFQLTSSRRGWPIYAPLSGMPLYISTHILTKRMTQRYLLLRLRTAHFNSHPHEEDDLPNRSKHWWCGYFNSHPHEEDDKELQCFHKRDSYISTHILTKRMTTMTAADLEKIIFQLTSSRRGWPVYAARPQYVWHFNSHPHEEDDVDLIA